MLEAPDLVNAVLFFTPGFVLVYTLHLVGVARRRSHYQAALWSIIASVPVRWAGAQLVSQLDLGVSQGLDLELYLLGVALVAGMIPGLVKRLFFFGEEEEERAQAMPSRANDS
ncbi:MAG: hypothetical protein PVH80_07255 [Anaerolineae bacterium]|jgi:hypothetical protein